jgi:hypothetical protein
MGSACEQLPTSAEARRPALTPSLAYPLDTLGLTDPATEVVLEVLDQLQPNLSGDADPLQDRRQIRGDGAALVLAHCRRPSLPWRIEAPKMRHQGINSRMGVCVPP